MPPLIPRRSSTDRNSKIIKSSTDSAGKQKFIICSAKKKLTDSLTSPVLKDMRNGVFNYYYDTKSDISELKSFLKTEKGEVKKSPL